MISDWRWCEIAIDFITELSESEECINVLTIVDYLKKNVIFKSCEWIDADTLVRIFI